MLILYYNTYLLFIKASQQSVVDASVRKDNLGLPQAVHCCIVLATGRIFLLCNYLRLRFQMFPEA